MRSRTSRTTGPANTHRLQGTFAPVSDCCRGTRAPNGTRFCGIDTADLVNAAYCIRQDSIGWDRAYLLPSLVDAFGPMSVVMVLDHEYGHAIQHKAGLVGDDDPGIVVEQQADCFAGAFIRHVAENGAPHFTLNTSDGLNSVLAATVSVRDADPNDPIRFTVRRSNGSPRPRSGSPTGPARAHG